MNLAGTLKDRVQGNSLAARLIFWMVVSSTLLSVLASGIQLYVSYQRDLSETRRNIDIYERSFHSSLASALWTFNFDQVEVILDSLAANQDVVRVDLDTTTGHSFSRALDVPSVGAITKSIALSWTDSNGGEAHLGDLRIGVSLAHVRARLWSQFWTLLATNFMKTMIASSIMLMLFHLVVARHLRAIASFVRGLDLASTVSGLRLARKPRDTPDDLDLVVDAIRAAQDRVRASYETVARLNRRLDSSNQDLARSNDELQRFAYVAAHDLQEPLRKITAFGDLLLEEYGGELVGDGREYIDFMVDASRRQQKLIKDLLIYSQLDVQAEDLKPLDLNRVLRATLDDLFLALKESGGRVEAADLPTVLGIDSQMKQVFANLIGNALKYRSPDRPPRILVRAELVDGQDDESPAQKVCRIFFEDNGIGFAQEHADQIFKPFKRLHGRSDYEGTGIGLAIVKKIVFHHGGEITAEGAPGQGSVFVLSLPLAVPIERSAA